MIDQGFPSVIVSDFNCINRLEKKRGGHPFMEDIRSREFGEFLYSNGLVDLSFVGPKFT